MVAKCNSCGHMIPYQLRDIKDITSNIVQTDIFGNNEEIIVGVVKCHNCGSAIYVKNRKETIKDLNSNKNDNL